ncbi:MAG: HlyD family efflux transporter periplasmic adaptor subunit, partial [Legionella sp.]
MSGLERIDGVDGRQVRTRAEIRDELNSWRYSFDRIEGESPEALLARAEATTQKVSSFLVDFARTANSTDSGASSTERAGVATARASVEGVLTTLSSQREALRDAQTAVGIASQQTMSTSARTASADASVKQALGSLRIAQASLEKTIIRAPIGGTINFLPIRVGDYVTSFTHVATVANNGSLEIVTYVSAADRELIAVGEQVTVEEAYTGIITSIAPALDPNTKRIEVHVAVTGTTELVNGQSVRIAFAHTVARPDAQLTGPVLLPLAAVKLRTSDRIVFTVDEAGMLVAVPVEIG